MKKEMIERENAWGFEDTMVIAAFRYCLGRRSYIVSCCTGWLIAQWPRFSEQTRSVIRRDLEEWFDRDDVARRDGEEYKPLGHDGNRASWCGVRKMWGNP